jgi:RND superfamily putative drug exporter
MKTTGGVIISAPVIMGGTFGAMGFSGVGTLVQIGGGTLIGLLLYAVVFMGLVVPSFSFLLGEANWWPFRRKDETGRRSNMAAQESGDPATDPA